jgi:O-antigen/teichoic acid export membrane protein
MSDREDRGDGLASRLNVRSSVSQTVHAGIGQFRKDLLLQNSVYIMLTTALMGLLGFAFWIISAHLFSARQIGLATALISATILISYSSLLGFNSTLVRFLPTSEHRDAEVSMALICVGVAALITAIGYVLIVPSVVPQLGYLRANEGYACVFVVLTVCSGVNLITDSVFIALRSPQYNLLIDGVIQSSVKLLLPVALVGLGFFGLYASTGLASAVAVVLSILFMWRAFEYRPRVENVGMVLRKTWGYGASSYLANLLNIVPILVLPLVVLKNLGAPSAGYYYVAFQVANLLYAVTYAIGQSLFAEGSHDEEAFRSLARRSAWFQAAIIIPAVVVLWVGASELLGIFGHGYGLRSVGVLRVLILAAPAVAINVWTSTLLRLTKQMIALIWSNVAYVVVICGLAAFWVDRGLVWVGIAWLVGNVVSGAVGGTALIMAGHGPRMLRRGRER